MTSSYESQRGPVSIGASKGGAAPKRVLVTGYLSTAGDIEAQQILCGWLASCGAPYDVAPFNAAAIPAIPGARGLETLEPLDYSHVVFVCGPMISRARLGDFFERFGHCWIGGLNLSILESLEGFDPFDFLCARDVGGTSQPDMTFLHRSQLAPVVGLCLVPKQREYGDRQRHADAARSFDALIAASDAAVIRIDTRLPGARNEGGLRSAKEIEALIARVDVLLTTRLHGMVFALKNGRPALVIDPIAGGAKVSAQARALGWPYVFSIDDVTSERLARALGECLEPAAAALAATCAEKARHQLASLEHTFMAKLDDGRWAVSPEATSR